MKWDPHQRLRTYWPSLGLQPSETKAQISLNFTSSLSSVSLLLCEAQWYRGMGWKEIEGTRLGSRLLSIHRLYLCSPRHSRQSVLVEIVPLLTQLKNKSDQIPVLLA